MASITVSIRDLTQLCIDPVANPDDWKNYLSECDKWLLDPWDGFQDIWYAYEYQQTKFNAAKAAAQSAYTSCMASHTPTPSVPSNTPSVSIQLGVSGNISGYSTMSRGGLTAQLNVPISLDNIPPPCEKIPREVVWDSHLVGAYNTPLQGVSISAGAMAGFWDGASGKLAFDTGGQATYSAGANNYVDFKTGLGSGVPCGYGFKTEAALMPNINFKVFLGAAGMSPSVWGNVSTLDEMWRRALVTTTKLKIDPLAIGGYDATLYSPLPVPEERMELLYFQTPAYEINAEIVQGDFYFDIEYSPPNGSTYRTLSPMVALKDTLQYNNGIIHLPEFDITSVLTPQLITAMNVPYTETIEHGEHKIKVIVRTMTASIQYSESSEKMATTNSVYLGSTAGTGLYAVEKTYKVYNFWTDPAGVMIECTSYEYNGWFYRADYTLTNTTDEYLKLSLKNAYQFSEYNLTDAKDTGGSTDFASFVIYLSPRETRYIYVICPLIFPPNSTSNTLRNEYGMIEGYAELSTAGAYTSTIQKNATIDITKLPGNLGMKTPNGAQLMRVSTNNTLEFNPAANNNITPPKMVGTQTTITIDYTFGGTIPQIGNSSTLLHQSPFYPTYYTNWDHLRFPSFATYQVEITPTIPPVKKYHNYITGEYVMYTESELRQYVTLLDASGLILVPVSYSGLSSMSDSNPYITKSVWDLAVITKFSITESKDGVTYTRDGYGITADIVSDLLANTHRQLIVGEVYAGMAPVNYSVPYTQTELINDVVTVTNSTMTLTVSSYKVKSATFGAAFLNVGYQVPSGLVTEVGLWFKSDVAEQSENKLYVRAYRKLTQGLFSG